MRRTGSRSVRLWLPASCEHVRRATQMTSTGNASFMVLRTPVDVSYGSTSEERAAIWVILRCVANAENFERCTTLR